MTEQIIWNWVGDCTTLFDKNGQSTTPLFTDRDDFNQIEEDAVVVILNKKQILNKPDHVRKNLIYSFHEERQIIIAYDYMLEVHHFFLPSTEQQFVLTGNALESSVEDLLPTS